MTRGLSRFAEAALGTIPILGLLVLWQAIVMSGIAPASLLPSPGAVFIRLFQQLGSYAFLENAFVTLYRLFTGFGIAVLFGVTLGIVSTGSRLFASIIKPIVRILAPIPKIALYPALTLTLGYDDASKIALVIADATFPILLATYQGAARAHGKGDPFVARIGLLE